MNVHVYRLRNVTARVPMHKFATSLPYNQTPGEKHYKTISKLSEVLASSCNRELLIEAHSKKKNCRTKKRFLSQKVTKLKARTPDKSIK
jgi:hypothetical protein